ncbi:MAG: manganese efflux pump [Pirellulaceae bacterium]
MFTELLPVVVSLDVVAVGMAIGADRAMNRTDAVKVIGAFGLSAGLMTCLGWSLAEDWVAEGMIAWVHTAVGLFFAGSGLVGLLSTTEKGEREPGYFRSPLALTVLAYACSVDCVLAGQVMQFGGWAYVWAGGVAGLVAALASSLGLWLGCYASQFDYSQKSSAANVAMLLAGIWMLAS